MQQYYNPLARFGFGVSPWSTQPLPHFGGYPGLLSPGVSIQPVGPTYDLARGPQSPAAPPQPSPSPYLAGLSSSIEGFAPMQPGGNFNPQGGMAMQPEAQQPVQQAAGPYYTRVGTTHYGPGGAPPGVAPGDWRSVSPSAVEALRQDFFGNEMPAGLPPMPVQSFGLGPGFS